MFGMPSVPMETEPAMEAEDTVTSMETEPLFGDDLEFEEEPEIPRPPAVSQEAEEIFRDAHDHSHRSARRKRRIRSRLRR